MNSPTIFSGVEGISFVALRLFSVYLIALAHIVNPKECEDLVFCGASVNETADHSLTMQLEDWNGEEKLYVRDDAWLEAIAVLLVG